MLKRYFIPLLLLLMAVAAAIYFLGGTPRKPRDVRAAVPVEKFLLTNGLTVVVMPNDRIPVVTHMLIVKAGSADDPAGKTGLAHYLEHLLFTGTTNFPEGVYDRAIARIGGIQNAYTNRDQTVYYATVPAKHLPMVMTMEADRLTNLTFDANLAARELKVITEERNLRTDTNPSAQFREQMDAMTFLNHPYHNPVIGWAEDMATFTPADAKGFFERYYRASNMTVLIAGDVTVRDARRLAQRYYGGLTSGTTQQRAWAKEPPVRMVRRGEMRDARVNEPRLLQQYAAPSVKHGDASQTMPLSVFAQYIGGGDASALYTSLVREQKLATQIHVDYDPTVIGPALFRISAIPAAGVTLPQLEEAIDRQLVFILESPLDAAAIARAQTQLKAEVTFAQDGMQQMANVMADLYATGLDENYFYQWADSIEAVSETDARAAAKAVLAPRRKVAGYLLPDEKPTPPAPTEGING